MITLGFTREFHKLRVTDYDRRRMRDGRPSPQGARKERWHAVTFARRTADAAAWNTAWMSDALIIILPLSVPLSLLFPLKVYDSPLSLRDLWPFGQQRGRGPPPWRPRREHQQRHGG